MMSGDPQGSLAAVLARAVEPRFQGTYVHIGAGHPLIASPTVSLYQAGWRGVNVEPVALRFRWVADQRPNDLNLHCAVGMRAGHRAFRSGLPVRPGDSAPTDPRPLVPTLTGDAVLAQAGQPVDLLVVYADGDEGDVLRSISLRRHAPRVVVVDAGGAPSAAGQDTVSSDPAPSWEPWLLGQGYHLAGSDGMDRFYIRADLAPAQASRTDPGSERVRPVPGMRRHLLRVAECLQTAHDLEVMQLGQAQHQALADARRALEAKERTIAELDRAVKAYRLAHYPLSLVLPALRRTQRGVLRLRSIVRPRLGQLRQYAPRPLAVPAHYGRSLPPPNPMRIALVTPSYGQGRFIETTLLSVIDQNYPRLDYVVQDGGSSDGTVAILQRHADRLSGWTSGPDEGQAHAINLGFTQAQGELMAWLNSDDLLLPGALAFVADFFDRHPEVDVVYGNRLLIDEDGQEIGRWILPGHDADALRWADYIPQETLFWRRALWDRVGGRLDESFQFAMDWDLLLRFQEAGARFAHVPRFLGAFRVHAAQKTSESIGHIGLAEMDRIRARLWGRVPAPARIRAKLVPFMIRHVIADLRYRISTRLGGMT
jgi:GT2 family glycosyltransferase